MVVPILNDKGIKALRVEYTCRAENESNHSSVICVTPEADGHGALAPS